MKLIARYGMTLLCGCDPPVVAALLPVATVAGFGEYSLTPALAASITEALGVGVVASAVVACRVCAWAGSWDVTSVTFSVPPVSPMTRAVNPGPVP